ncbi:MAG: DNA mismatch repair endonuclease MutL [Acidobacteria bacterium]|nr:DNA mismatch repair endonuclease MutL [Acidobacteriota bacterium]
MSKVRVLPEHLANTIAAGEVVERPASVAKELVENALDAGATRIEVEIGSAGRSLVRVADDGEGMTRDDAILAFERHATSKLRTVDDLSNILTFGFRGEALPSIASVSKLTLTTRVATEAAGTQIVITGGRLGNVRDVAWPVGTEIAVRDLFFNVPARRKFMRSDATETYHVTNLVTHYALANPGVGFTLTSNGRESIGATPVASLRERAYQLLGPATVDRLVELDGDSSGVRVLGFASNPQEQRTSRDAQYLFVNGRFVRDKSLGRAIADGYRSMMPSGTYPAVVLFVELAPERIDVNVHPAKTEIRFRDEHVVRAAVASAIRSALDAARVPVTPFPAPIGIAAARDDVSEPVEAPVHVPAPIVAAVSAPAAAPPWLSPPPARAAQPALDLDFRPPVPVVPVLALEPAAERIESSPGLAVAGAGDAPIGSMHRGLPLVREDNHREGALRGQLRPLGQIRDSFIVATDEEGLLLVDQHVAHERILFERFRSSTTANPPARQALLLPETIDLTPAQGAAYERIGPELDAAGFDVLELSGRTIAVSAVPAELPPGDARALLLEILDAAGSGQGRASLDAVRETIAASLACRAAIKINMPLSDEKLRWLLDGLLATENPWTCPHGRPVILRFTIRDIERQFQRPEGFRKES